MRSIITRTIELYLTEIIRSVSQMFVMCLVDVWQLNFERMVCVYSLMGWELVVLVVVVVAPYSLMMDRIRSETRWSDF